MSGEYMPDSNASSFNYIKARGIWGMIILPITRWFRAVSAERYMKPARRHLDIGCGDGYFLRRSKCKECFGLDKLSGDEVKDKLKFPDNYFDYVTLLAVIEHINSADSLIGEITRVLRPGGKLLITTPSKIAHRFIKIYARDIDVEHVCYYDLEKIKSLTRDNYDIKDSHRFLFGLNQVFCLEKRGE